MARPGVYDFPASESSTSDKQPAWHPDEQQRAVEQPPELPQLYKEWPATLSRPSARSQPTPSKQQRRRRWSTLFTTNKSASPPDLNPPDYFSLSNLPSPTCTASSSTFPTLVRPTSSINTPSLQPSKPSHRPLSFINFRQRLSWNTQSFSAHPAPSPLE
ncbi:hypothetical protein Pst134EB_024004 [Puccinia striiformis f. sp. tritici]|nr:hypothetical protein Pst134EB_024004 [Puccinia striiformis f. sp. tritici]